jgi:2-polyprenyl-6-methoxyphenol hydroxylase-like FAD-dependent oxidoreductase
MGCRCSAPRVQFKSLKLVSGPQGHHREGVDGLCPVPTIPAMQQSDVGYDVCVRGAGAVGMSLALALSRQGLKVALQHEPVRAAPAFDVRAYALNPRSMQLLSELKVWDALAQDARTPVYDMHVEGDAPGAALDFSAYAQGIEALAWIVDAAELDAQLRRALQYAPHVNMVEHEVQATLLALVDGNSGKAAANRKALGVQTERLPYGQRAVAARLQSDRPHAGLARQWFRSPDVLALLPFDRPKPGHSYGLVWSVPETRADELLALDNAAFEHALMGATGGAAGTLQLSSARAAWPLSLVRADRVCGPGWVLLGDAAHVVHPLAGQGLNLGLADVATLARVIAARESFRALGDDKLLRRYSRERHTPTRAMGHVTDGLLQLFASQQPAVKELRNRGLSLLNALPPLKKLLTAQALQS